MIRSLLIQRPADVVGKLLVLNILNSRCLAVLPPYGLPLSRKGLDAVLACALNSGAMEELR
jgi:hypothetical protein